MASFRPASGNTTCGGGKDFLFPAADRFFIEKS